MKPIQTIKYIKLGAIAVFGLFGISGFLTVIQHCDPNLSETSKEIISSVLTFTLLVYLFTKGVIELNDEK